MGAFWGYLAERIVILFATVFLSVTVVFFVPRLVPGDPLGAIFVNFASIGGNMGGDALVEEYRERFGLDESMWNQYVSYLRQLAQGDLGYSIASFPSHVTDLLRSAIPWTVGLLGLTTVISWLLGSLLGAIVGWKADKSPFLQSLVPLALVLYTTPYYILAIILVFVFAFYWPVFPLSGAYSAGSHPELTLDFAGQVIKHGTLPALSIVLVSLGWWFLSMRSLIVAEQGQDYILWAEAKGLGSRRIFWGYAFRNALLPQTTGLALSFGHIVGGALVTEAIFAYPGVGWLIYSSIKSLDYPVIQGSVLLLIFSVAVANFVMDLTYPLIDPRIRFGSSTRT
jgi:peptide/nickel transport system permease protein